MIETLLQAIMEQIEQPKKDVEHNLRALLNEAVSKMDLVSKDEIETTYCTQQCQFALK